MHPFTYEAPAQRVVFGHGTLAGLRDEVRRLGRTRALVLSTPAQEADARRLAAQLGSFSAGIFTQAAMHTPVEVTQQAMQAVAEAGADCLVSLGGGSTTGLGKAIALRTGLDQVAVPTTYAGSEATPILGQTEGGRKTTLRDRSVLPEVVLYDVALTVSLPPALSAASGMNAMAHAVEALYAPDRNPVTAVLAEAALASLARALPAIMADPADLAARSDALYGAWAAGTCLGTVGMGLHHKLCHILGGSFGLPHAETHAVLLPHAFAYNAGASPEAAAAVARAIGAADPAQGLYALGRRLGLPTGLAALGLTTHDLDLAASEAVQAPYPNPAPLYRPAIRALLADALAGHSPGRHGPAPGDTHNA